MLERTDRLINRTFNSTGTALLIVPDFHASIFRVTVWRREHHAHDIPNVGRGLSHGQDLPERRSIIHSEFRPSDALEVECNESNFGPCDLCCAEQCSCCYSSKKTKTQNGFGSLRITRSATVISVTPLRFPCFLGNLRDEFIRSFKVVLWRKKQERRKEYRKKCILICKRSDVDGRKRYSVGTFFTSRIITNERIKAS